MPKSSCIATPMLFYGTNVLTENSSRKPYFYGIITKFSSLSLNYIDNFNIITCDFSNGILQSEKSDAMLQLDEIEKLPYNWNENNAEPFSKKLIDKCRGIISNLTVIPRIYPAANNSIQFEYYKSDGELLEFNVFENNITMFKRSFRNEAGECKRESRDKVTEKEMQTEAVQFYE